MGVLISINGADFEPYQGPAIWNQTSRVRPAHRARAAARVGDESNNQHFQKVLQQTIARQYKQKQEGTVPERQERHPWYVKDLMSTEVETLRPEAPAAEAFDLITSRGFRHVPVVAQTGRIVGMLSDRDLLASFSRSESRSLLTVNELMSGKVVVATPKTFLFEAAEAMLKDKINSLPVTNEAQQVIGILTTTDILKSLVHKPTLELWA